MRLILIILALAVTLANSFAVAQESADMIGNEHHLTNVDHSDHQNEPDQHGLLAHHCCHTQAHIFILPQAHLGFAKGEAIVWIAPGPPSPLLVGYAPPVPPPKA